MRPAASPGMQRRQAVAGALLLGGTPLAGAGPGCGPYEVALYEFGSLYYRNAQGERVGIDPEVLQEVARRTGCEFRPFLDSRAHTWASLAEGRLDMTVSAVSTPERLASVRIVPYLVTRNHLILRQELARRVASLDAFERDQSLRLGVVRGFRHGPTLDPWIDALRVAGRVSDFPDAEVVARVFAARRIEGFFSQPLTWRPLLERNGLQGQVRMLDVLPRESVVAGLALSIARVREEDAERMRQAVAAMRADGTLLAILTRHVGARVAREVAAEP